MIRVKAGRVEGNTAASCMWCRFTASLPHSVPPSKGVLPLWPRAGEEIYILIEIHSEKHCNLAHTCLGVPLLLGTGMLDAA